MAFSNIKYLTRLKFTIIVLLFNSLLKAQTSPSQEYQIKAVFLFNFSQFIEWPTDNFNDPNAPFVIGVLGKNPFGSYLNDAVTNEKVNGHSILVQYYSTIEEIKTCNILFINFTETKKLGETIESLKGKNILTVSDANNFIKQGGIIRFYTKYDKIQLQINPEAAKESDLTVSSKLLRLSEIVVPKK